MDKNVFFEASVHTPFLLRYPGKIAPNAFTDLVESVDLLPTVLDFCGIPIPRRVQGRSLAPLVSGNRSGYSSRELVFSENIIPEVITSGSLNMPFVAGAGVAGIRHPDAKMVRSTKWKLNYYPGHGYELYDLRNDPSEEHDLSGDGQYKDVVSDLRQALLDWMITADENDQIAPRWMI